MLAFVNARIRARRSRLLDRDALVYLATTDQPGAVVQGWRDVADEADASSVLALVYGRLIAEYVVAVRACPAAGAAIRVLACVHEIENVKLAWRAVVRRREVSDWMPSWRPMGALETVNRDACKDATTLPALVAALARTPYGEIARVVARAHSADPGAAAAAFDRWIAAQVVAGADALPRHESAARELLRLAPLAADTPASERRRRRTACRRAFIGSPYLLAPLVAYLLTRDAEARALVSIAEVRARHLQAAEVVELIDAVT